MTVSEEKLAGADQALAELGRSEAEIAEVRGRFANAAAVDLEATDAILSTLAEGVSVELTSSEARASVAQSVEDVWDDEHTEVEIIDESDFVLLVDENELEELEKVGEDDAVRSLPPALPQEGADGEEGDGFFKKLFGNRRSSNRP
ncbi:MAG TPA: hypothetical protein VFG22_14180 [Polyangiales bacterium]|nr:hypothetical protein [Polyangiales bacterium]